MKKFFKEFWVELKEKGVEFAPYWILMGFHIGVVFSFIFLTILISIFGLCA